MFCIVIELKKKIAKLANLNMPKQLNLSRICCIILMLLNSCIDWPVNEGNNDPDDETVGNIYFPSNTDQTWAKADREALSIDEAKLQELVSWVKQKNGDAFIVTHKGKIITENYWNGWNRNTFIPVTSISKSILSVVAGMAQEQGYIDIQNKTSDYLGKAWSSAPEEKEDLITLRHHLTMTTGFDEFPPFPEGNLCSQPKCLLYEADAGGRWTYHQGPVAVLKDVIETTTNKTFSDYARNNLTKPIGMRNEHWLGDQLICSARDLARFGIFVQADFSWKGELLLHDEDYKAQMFQSSQSMNPSYGYLWWLNGKGSYILPATNEDIQTDLVATAPDDLLTAIGLFDQKLFVLPSRDLVVVRLGAQPETLVTFDNDFDEQLWLRILNIFPE